MTTEHSCFTVYILQVAKCCDVDVLEAGGNTHRNIVTSQGGIIIYLLIYIFKANYFVFIVDRNRLLRCS